MKIKVATQPSKSYMIKVKFKDEREEAHKYYIMRRNDIIFNLCSVYNNEETPAIYRKYIKEAAQFIMEGEK